MKHEIEEYKKIPTVDHGDNALFGGTAILRNFL